MSPLLTQGRPSVCTLASCILPTPTHRSSHTPLGFSPGMHCTFSYIHSSVGKSLKSNQSDFSAEKPDFLPVMQGGPVLVLAWGEALGSSLTHGKDHWLHARRSDLVVTVTSSHLRSQGKWSLAGTKRACKTMGPRMMLSTVSGPALPTSDPVRHFLSFPLKTTLDQGGCFQLQMKP